MSTRQSPSPEPAPGTDHARVDLAGLAALDGDGELRRVVAADPGPVDRRILAAARECLIERGLTRSTIAEVARRAGVSRPTVYARFANAEDLTAQVLTRELVTLLAGIAPLPGTVDELVERAVDVTRAVRDSEFVAAVLDRDPQVLATYQFRRLGRSQRLITGLLREIIAGLQARPDGGVRAGDPGDLALVILTTMQAHALSARAVTPAFSHPDQWETQLRRLLKGYLSS